MGMKLLWTGLVIFLALARVWSGESANIEFVGAVIMIIGLVLMWLDK